LSSGAFQLYAAAFALDIVARQARKLGIRVWKFGSSGA
jgi:hypothetical protein